jgi:tRNA (guanine10-N2)-dimethyltransferase
MPISKHIYCFSYDNTESELCKLESSYLFNQEDRHKLLLSDIKVEPSHSAFINRRLDVLTFSEDYTALLNEIKNENICVEGFKIEYLVIEGDTTSYAARLDKLRDIGYIIEGIPDYYNPTTTYCLCYYDGFWCFGNLIKNSFDWQKHNQKPHSYSNSISINIAKALVNIAARGNKETKLLDACCGAGTIMLEACFAGINMDGCDINWKLCRDARKNLTHFNYRANVYRSDIKDITQRYDTAIIDLPYNLLSVASDTDIAHIMTYAAAVTDRLAIVSTADITDLIGNTGYRITNYCSVSKKGKTNFARKIWVCDKKT